MQNWIDGVPFETEESGKAGRAEKMDGSFFCMGWRAQVLRAQASEVPLNVEEAWIFAANAIDGIRGFALAAFLTEHFCS